MEEINNFDVLKNNLSEINDKIKKYFDIIKIDHTSITIKKGAHSMLFLSPVCNLNPIIFLVKHISSNYSKKIDILFPTKDILINIFKLVDIKLFEEDEIYESEISITNLFEISKGNIIYETCFEFLIANIRIIDGYNKTLEHIKNNINIISKKYIKESNDIEQLQKETKECNEKLTSITKNLKTTVSISVAKTLKEEKLNLEKYMDNIENIFLKKKLVKEELSKRLNTLKKDLYNFNILTINSLSDFIRKNIKFEPELFSEIFNIETDKKETDEITFLRQNYIFYARKIKEIYEKINNTTYTDI